MVKPIRTYTIPDAGYRSMQVGRHEPGSYHPLVMFYTRLGPYRAYYEEIHSDNGREAWHNCKHIRETQSLYETFVPWCYEYSGTQWYDYGSQSPTFWLAGGTLDEDINRPSLDATSYEVDLYNQRALAALLPGARSRLSLVNSLWELKDFISLKRSVGRVLSLARNLSEVLSGVAGLKSLSLRQIARVVADIELQKEFNVKPLIGDVMNTYNSLRAVRAIVRELLAREGSYQLRHYSCQLVGFNSATISRSPSTFGESYYTVESDPTHYTFNPISTMSAPPTITTGFSYPVAQFNATLEYSYELSSFQRENALIGTTLDMLGVNLNPAILWNAIPWSFVVDWVLGVSKYLDGMKVRNVEPCTTIHRYCYSTKVMQEAVCSISMPASTHMSGSGNKSLGSRSRTIYYRVVAPPRFTHWLETSGISSREFVLGAALATTQL